MHYTNGLNVVTLSLALESGIIKPKTSMNFLILAVGLLLHCNLVKCLFLSRGHVTEVVLGSPFGLNQSQPLLQRSRKLYQHLQALIDPQQTNAQRRGLQAVRIGGREFILLHGP